MGREWYQWGAKSSKNRVWGGRRSSAGAKPEPPLPEVVAAAAAATGCMGVVSHLFDFHHLQLCLNNPNHPQESPFDSTQDNLSSLKGFEAPRNSLETEAVDTNASLASASEAQQEIDDNLPIPMGIQINTGRRDTRLLKCQSPSPKLVNSNYFSFSEQENSNAPALQINTANRRDTKLLRVRAPKPETGEEQKNSHFSTDSSNSPLGPRTPTLVARLMGLDLLPEGYPSSSSCTPRSSNATPHRPHSHSVTPKGSRRNSPKVNGNIGSGAYDFSASLMETPRLSLQINKENRGAKEEVVELSRHSCSEINTKRRDLSWKGIEEESLVSRSPGYYARQIMKQVKESVMRRKFGVDITNKSGEPQTREQSKDVHANDVIAKKEVARNPLSPSSPIRDQKEASKRAEPVEIVKPKKRQEKAQQPKLDWRMRKTESAKKGANPIAKRTMNKKEEQFVRADAVATTRASQGSDKKCKTTPLSSELLLHGNVVPSLVPLKKSDASIAPTGNRKPVQKAELPKPRPLTPPESAKFGAASAAATRSEFNYISQILKRAGINRDTPVSSFTRWFSSSHPLDPSLFHFLEVGGGGELSPPCNRRLMFDLVDEILAHIIKPKKVGRELAQSGPSEWARLHGFQVMRMVWTKVKAFPRADCKILQDIDELVEMDLSGQASGSGMDAGFKAGEEEEDDIVAEIERELVEALVFDTAVAVVGRGNGYFLHGDHL
ncbi:hypothetical protein V2J09_014529 [Rumex salicifolius]